MSTELDRRGAGVLLGALLHPATADDALAHLGEPTAGACREALAGLAVRDRAARLARVRELSRGLLSPVPLRLHLLHPSWLEARLKGRHPAIVAAVAEVLPAAFAARVGASSGAWRLAPTLRARALRDVFAPFTLLDAPAAADKDVEAFLVAPAALFEATLELLALGEDAREAVASFADLVGVTRARAVGAAVAMAALAHLDVAEGARRLALRLPRDLALVVEARVSALPRDAAWVSALVAAWEKSRES